MKKFELIIAEINKNSQTIFALNEQRKNLGHAEICEAVKQIDNLTFTNKVLANNARHALFSEVFADVLEIMNKYAGKPMGAKTSEKLQAEVRAKTHCCIYIDDGTIDIYKLTDDGFSYGNEYAISINTDTFTKRILDNNRLQVYSIEEYRLNNAKDYIEDIPEYLKQLEELKAEAKKVQEQLAAICNDFNSLAVDGIKHLDAYNYIY